MSRPCTVGSRTDRVKPPSGHVECYSRQIGQRRGSGRPPRAGSAWEHSQRALSAPYGVWVQRAGLEVHHALRLRCAHGRRIEGPQRAVLCAAGPETEHFGGLPQVCPRGRGPDVGRQRPPACTQAGKVVGQGGIHGGTTELSVQYPPLSRCCTALPIQATRLWRRAKVDGRRFCSCVRP